MTVLAAPAHPGLELNPEQQAAVAHGAGEGPLLVIAGAGTGKTATLAARAAALVRAGTDTQRLLLVTFSRRAALEMQRRVSRLLRQDLGLRSDAPPLQLPWCGTFHAAAARLLRELAPHIGLAAGFTVLDRGDAEDLMGLARTDLGLAAQTRRFPVAATCLAIHSRVINAARPLAEVLRAAYPWCEPLAADLQRLFDAYAAAKRAQHSLDFDDLLRAWWLLLQDAALAERIAARFDQVLVDEAQDMNRLQAEIVLALRPRGQGLTLVGDDAQAIYSFRGAELRHLLEFPQRFEPPARVLALTRNYRSTMPLLAASNAVIAEAGARFDKALWSPRTTGARPALRTVADEAAQAAGVADAVLAAREQGVAFKRQAVLFRTSHHSTALELELARRRIPFVKYGGLRFLESAHVKDVLALLRWADNPASALSAWRVARLVPGLGPASARRLAAAPHAPEAFRPPSAAAAEWQALHQLLQRLRGADAAGSAALPWPADLQAVLDWYRPQLERLHDAPAARWQDLQQLAAIAATQRSRERFLTELALDPPAASSDESGEPHRDEDYLILSTIHSAKGQEWSAVHVLNVVDGCMPADLATGDADEIDEERRLLYVAMTRARDQLTLWSPQRFYVTQQRAFGDRHLYALRSRFITDAMLPLYDRRGTGPEETAPGTAPSPAAAGLPPPSAAAAAPPDPVAPAAPGFDLFDRLRG